MLEEIKRDLADNYANDDSVLKDIIEDMTENALSISNRVKNQKNIDLLKSNIKKAVKTVYLQRGKEDVKSDSMAGISSAYDQAIETMTKDIIRQNKRLLK